MAPPIIKYFLVLSCATAGGGALKLKGMFDYFLKMALILFVE